MPSYTISGRILSIDGTPVVGATVSILEILDLSNTRERGTGDTTDSAGSYSVSWAETAAPAPWDLFVRATDNTKTVDSALISDLAHTAVVDLVLGEGLYEGRSEWDRVAAKVTPLIGVTEPKDLPAARLEWLAARADVFPLHLAAYIQAHRLADGRTVKPTSFYALLRSGLPANLLELLRTDESAWEGALRDAWARSMLPLPGGGSPADQDDEVATELAAIRALSVEAAVAAPISGVNQRIIFDTAGLSETNQRTFAALWLEHEGPIGDFWTAVAGSDLASEVDLLKFTVEAATLVGAHLGTLEALQRQRTTSAISTMADTAAWSITDWNDLLVAELVTPPDEIPGTGADKQEAYARALFNVLEDTYPSASLRASIEREVTPPPQTEFVATFLANNPNFDIGESTVGLYLANASSPWSGIDPADQAEARAHLETVQRVYRVTPRVGRYAAMKILLDEGLRSAAQIVESTRSEFVASFGTLFTNGDHDGEAQALAIWENAAQVHSATIAAVSMLAFTKTNADSLPVQGAGAEAFATSEHGLPELSAILGNLDYCACEHCRSVFSPAAYLADLLTYLQKRPAQSSTNALQVLLARRPDIQHILLDCANTNTVLPYIDLVNELLEDFIAGGLGGSSKQTTWMASELRLHPEHLDPSLYEGATITQTVHPWTLPFSLPTVEAQTYLQHLGVPRHELMRRFTPVEPSVGFLDAMAGDLLGLDAASFAIVAGDHLSELAEGEREYWGFGAGDDHWFRILNGTAEPLVHGVEGDVGELLLRGRLTLDELQELLELDYINPTGSIMLQWSESCKLADASIAFLEAEGLDRIHRFVRLQRATKISARMLNVLLKDALGGTLNAAALRSLADIVRVKNRLRLSWDEVATFWATVIDGREYRNEPRALYTRRFLAKDFGPVDPNFAPAGDGTRLFGESVPPTPISDAQLPRVLAGLGIKANDYQLLVNADPDLATNAFSFANLAALLRCVLLARGLHISIADFVRLAGPSSGMTNQNPFADPEATLAFIDQVVALRDSDFSITELDWLLRHKIGRVDPLDEATIGRDLGGLARGLNAIETEVMLLVDPDGSALATNLVQLLEPPELTEGLKIVDRTVVDVPTQQAFIDAHFGTFVDTTLAKNVLVNEANEAFLPELPERRAWLLARVVGHLRRRALIIDTIAGKFGLAAMVVEVLLDTVLTNPAANEALFEVFRVPFATDDEIAAGLTPASHGNVFAAWTKLTKATILCRRFDMRAEQVAWYSGRGDWLSLDALPLDDEDADASFESWDRLRRALALRSLSRPGELAPAQIAETTTLAAAIEILADHAGWNAATVLAAAQALGYNDDHATEVAEEVIPERLRVIVETQARLGVDLLDLFAWATLAPTLTQTAAIKASTRAKYGEDRWAEVGKPLRDQIRKRQRDALVDAAIATTPSLRASNDVFEHLLIDVEMSPCMMTSRIKQAIASVQIFIHRVLLHLEVEQITFDAEAIDRWSWMKNYRVWEANRKVFLYPENWIEPELRRDKTPEFQELEAKLMQGVLDQDRVEKALGGYLEQFARIANLEMISICLDPTTFDIWILARTQASPHEWFVRQRVLRTGEWTPWEAVPHKIDSSAVVLIPTKGRVHIFWANKQEAEQDPNDKTVPVYYTIGHVQKTTEGWGKATISDPSAALLLPRHRHYRLNFFVRERAIDLQVFWQSSKVLDGRVGAAVAFYYDRVTEQIGNSHMYDSPITTPEQLDFNGKLIDVRFFNDNMVLPLPPSHNFEGQRNRRHINSGYDADYGQWSDSPIVRFVQGYADVELFQRASEGRAATVLHQADMVLYSDARDTLLPAIYDDRQRKYVLIPLLLPDPKESNPAYIASFNPLDYSVCPSISVNPPPPEREQPALRMVRDEVQTRRPWANGAPGRNATLISSEAADSPDAPAYTTSILLSKSTELMQGNVALAEDGQSYPVDSWAYVLWMEAMYHPFARYLQETLVLDGLSGLYAPPPDSPLFRQLATYNPFDEEMGINEAITRGAQPVEEFDFSVGSPYAVYNWELFYHLPMLVASKLATEQRWDEAQRWYHLMFNPVELAPGEDGPSRFWRIKPFAEEAESLAMNQFQLMLGIGASEAEKVEATSAFAKQVGMWLANPFDPHAVARIRPGVYQRALLRKYFDNLITWADHLFRRDTIESITEATILYIVLAQLLGRRPQDVPAPGGEAKTFQQLDALGLDAFSNAIVQLESWIHLPAQPAKRLGCGDERPSTSWVRVPVLSRFWYFCYPPNPELLKYWDIVEDRLFKIRHCQNIDGVERQLPLFEPPIDPALLVQATAAGVDLRSALAELDSGLPPYRFRSVHARATAFTNTLKSLGSALLSALEKQDAEELSRIRSGHELETLARVRDVRVQQRDEAAAAIGAIERSILGARARQSHYMKLLVGGLSAEEDRAFELQKQARNWRHVQQSQHAVGGILGAIPQINVGLAPGVEFGGQHLANVFSAGAAAAGMVASEYEYHAGKASTVAGYKRREQDWSLQANQVFHEIERLERDLIVAKIRASIAERELKNHDLQAEQAQSVDEYMRSKFTNRELYDWMIGQLSTLYFQTYQLAFDLGKRAERAYRHELAIDPDNPAIIKYGYWDSLRKGLLAGDKLGLDLERLDLAYMDRDLREFELRKSISLAELDPYQVRQLQEGGECTFHLPEALFDLDHPGHYLRRIRAVRLTIPAVVGPFTTLGARLQLQSHRTRFAKTPAPEYIEQENDDRFRHGSGAGQAIATSTAMSDGGLFNLDFKDERYLPFEYAGAISSWKLELPEQVRQFDYRTIEDVIIHIDYTARDGGSGLRDAAEAALAAHLNTMLGGTELPLGVSIHDAFPNEWEQFFSVVEGEHVLTLPIVPEYFPHFARHNGFGVTKVNVLLLLDPSLASESLASIATEIDLEESAENLVHAPGDAFMTATFTLTAAVQPGTWTLTIADSQVPAALQSEGKLDPEKVVGLALVLRYTLST